MISRRVSYAVLIAFLFHGLFILTARYRLSYDAYNHMFFADHYAKDWFSLWDSRWFGGFEVISYPPLVHQLIALLSYLIGVDAAYGLVQWAVMSMYPLAIYSFSRIFFGRSVSGYAALGTALLSSLYYAGYAFGQLPTLTATLFALFGMTSLADFLRTGNRLSGVLAVALMTIVMAAHHATLLFLPWAVMAVVFHILLNQKVDKRIFIMRLSAFGIFAILGGLTVIWPFWEWGTKQAIQTPIDHLSRHNFFKDRFAFDAFFLPMYGPMLIVFPFILWKGFTRRHISLTLAFLILVILGLGGTTPLPRLLFGTGWEWLTYDRFAFWASLILTPFFGVFWIHIRRTLPRKLSLRLELFSSKVLNPLMAIQKSLQLRRVVVIITFAVFALVSFIAGSVPVIFQTQPDPVDMKPIVEFLATEDYSDWRYLTFGFGDQMAYLSRLTDATTIDGSYFTARTLPELRESGIGLIDSAFWSIKGVSGIGPILQKSGDHGVRWGFVNRREFISELKKNGWVFVKFLKNGIQVWENPNVSLPEESKPPLVNPFASFSWGVFPLLLLATTIMLAYLRLWPKSGEKIIRGIYMFLIGLIPLSLCFWYYMVVGKFKHERVYFTYDHALFFLSDAIMLMAVLLWLAVQVSNNNFFQQKFSTSIKLLFALCVLITLSTLWSTDWRTSAYIALHFWLVFLLILSMRDWHESWSTAILGLCAALSIQALTGIVGFILQSTAFLDPLNLEWPGTLDSLARGASIIKLPDGHTFLRAYGTLSHPNILGGFILLCLLGPIALFLRKEKPNSFALLLLILGSSLLALTFSRSAWIGAAIFLFILMYRSKYFNPKHTAIVFGFITIAFVLTLYPLRNLVLNRTSSPATTTEEFSISGRIWLAKQSIELIKENPILGVGAGSFIIELENRAREVNYVEPVHNILLLVTSELGILGLFLILAIIFSIGKNFIETKNPNAIILGSLIAGLGVISLLDHYLWTIAPGRLMLGFALGLWEGQTAAHDTQ